MRVPIDNRIRLDLHLDKHTGKLIARVLGLAQNLTGETLGAGIPLPDGQSDSGAYRAGDDVSSVQHDVFPFSG
jgi:hypothetical protein